jgi:hypothetical protein
MASLLSYDTKKSMQRAISSQQARVSEASGSYQYRYQEGRECGGWIDVIRRSQTDRHVLPNRFHEADLVQEGNENRDPAKGGHGALRLAQDQSLIRQQGVDLARD